MENPDVVFQLLIIIYIFTIFSWYFALLYFFYEDIKIVYLTITPELPHDYYNNDVLHCAIRKILYDFYIDEIIGGFLVMLRWFSVIMLSVSCSYWFVYFEFLDKQILHAFFSSNKYAAIVCFCITAVFHYMLIIYVCGSIEKILMILDCLDSKSHYYDDLGWYFSIIVLICFILLFISFFSITWIFLDLMTMVFFSFL
jgi:hypothetical protein